MYKAFGLQNTNVIYNVLYLQYFKKYGYIRYPKKRYRRPTNSKAEKPAKPRNPPIPSETQANPEIETIQTGPKQSQLLSTGTAPTPKFKPAKAPARAREPEIQQKSSTPPRIKRQQTSPGTPSTSKLPINYSTFKCGKSCAISWLLLCIVPNLYLSPDLFSSLAF